LTVSVRALSYGVAEKYRCTRQKRGKARDRRGTENKATCASQEVRPTTNASFFHIQQGQRLHDFTRVVCIGHLGKSRGSKSRATQGKSRAGQDEGKAR
jgi:hypothetical protein